MNSLRAQITASQNVRSDLMKWKLLVIAALGTAGLGLGNGKFSNSQLILCFIPLVSVYVDALCAHLSLRIKAIGEFIASVEPVTRSELLIRDYERFIRISPPRFKFETIALHWSTIFMSILVILYGYSNVPEPMTINLPKLGEFSGAIPFYVSGILGFVLTIVVLWYFKLRTRIICECGQDERQRLSKGAHEAS